MTSEEIKAKYSMRDILAKYGIQPNRSGFICCPFHKGDREASMKIYGDSYYCFGCGASGDIFSFVERMEGCGFKDAFYALGGTYEKPSFESNLVRYRMEQKRAQKAKMEARERQKRILNQELIDIYRDAMEGSCPLSDVWCDSYNALQYQLYLHGELNGIPY